MKSSFHHFLYLAILWSSTFLTADPITAQGCDGGDGPNPLINISSSFPTTFDEVPLNAELNDFLYREKSETIIYRTDNNQLFQHDIKSQKQRFLGTMESPLSPIIDEEEKYILTDSNSYFLDTSLPLVFWSYFETPLRITQHLFWRKEEEQDVLYSLSEAFNIVPHKQSFIIYRYGNGDSSPSQCNLVMEEGERYSIGKGHEFPTIFLYKTHQVEQTTRLEFYQVDLNQVKKGGYNSCQLKPVHRPIVVQGQVRSVHRFMDQKSFMVELENRSQQVIYMNQGLLLSRCVLYDFGERKPVILGTKHPRIASWDEEDGISLVFPHKKSRASIFPGLSGSELTERNYWFSDNNKKLFVAVPTENSEGRRLFFTELPK